MSFLLHIETATPLCSVALSQNDQLIRAVESETPNAHSSLLSVYINELLDASGVSMRQLSAVSVSNGPGSYTGLRIGLSTAKGICYGLDIPLIVISTLQILAATELMENNSLPENGLIIPLMDARRMEVFTAAYSNKLTEIIAPHALILSSDSYKDLLSANPCVFIGDGLEKTKPILSAFSNFISGNQRYPKAEAMAMLAYEKYQKNDFADVAYIEPFYIKEAYTTQPKSS
jgi:tRNA threonylcarbamoyladenosine biosynthesis protein TsaB